MGVAIEKVGSSSFIHYKGKNYEVCFCSNGASIYSYAYKGHSWFFSPIDKKAFLSSKGFYGKTLGPIAGRYKIGEKVICHGGDHALSFREFDYSYKATDQLFLIEFSLFVDEDSSFYGNHVSYKVIYEVDEEGEILVNYHLLPETDTYASLSLHSYFLFDKEDIRELNARIDAKEVSILNDDLSIHHFAPVSEAFSFKVMKQLKSTYVEKENLTTRGHYLRGVKYPAEIQGDRCGLTIASSFPSALIYLDSAPVGEIGLSRQKEKQFSCFVFEPEVDPSNKEELLIKAKETKSNWIKLIFHND